MPYRKKPSTRYRSRKGRRMMTDIVPSNIATAGAMAAVVARGAARNYGAINDAVKAFQRAHKQAADITKKLKSMGLRPKSVLDRKGVGATKQYTQKYQGKNVTSTNASGINQMTRQLVNYGKPKSLAVTVRKLEKKDSHSIGLIWQRIAALNDVTAGLSLPNSNSGGTNFLPIHLYRLDDKAVPGGLFTATSHAIGYAVDSSDTTNQIGFSKIVGQNMQNTNFDAYGLQTLWSNGVNPIDSATNPSLWDHSVLRSIKVDLMLRGIRTRPTTYKIQLVQFLRHEVMPEFVPAAGSDAEKERTRFWTQYAKPLVAHPLANNPRDFKPKQAMRVIKTWWHKFQPDLSTNLDTTPPQHRITLKLNLNRYCDYTPLYTAPDVNVNEIYTNEPETLIESTQVSNHAWVSNWKARMYLIISASVSSGPSTEATLYPQYDISLRPIHTLRDIHPA